MGADERSNCTVTLSNLRRTPCDSTGSSNKATNQGQKERGSPDEGNMAKEETEDAEAELKTVDWLVEVENEAETEEDDADDDEVEIGASDTDNDMEEVADEEQAKDAEDAQQESVEDVEARSEMDDEATEASTTTEPIMGDVAWLVEQS